MACEAEMIMNERESNEGYQKEHDHDGLDLRRTAVYMPRLRLRHRTLNCVLGEKCNFHLLRYAQPVKIITFPHHASIYTYTFTLQ